MSQVAQIIRTVGYLRFAHRFYSSRKVPDHYKTLGIKSDASTKDIKAAFIKLSKQSHPDTANKQDHADFVKISEAYNVLSKDRTRSAYDAERMEATVRSIHVRYPYEVMTRRRSDSKYEEWSNDFRYRTYSSPIVDEATRRKRSVTIVFGCILLSAFGFGLQLLAIAKSPVFNRDKLLSESEKYSNEHKALRDEVTKKSQAETVIAFIERFADEETLRELEEMEAASGKDK